MSKLTELPREELERIFAAAPFIRELGIRLAGIGPGTCHTELALEPRHLQQHGVVHAGVQATMADHSAGGAAATLAPEGSQVLTIEFKINLLRPARGKLLRCRASVLKPGSQVMVAESEVYCDDGEGVKLVSKLTASIAVVPGQRGG